ncbi:MAG: hypothetical protein Q9P01_03745 [Anaerolineae bacterium]|nr:hypothetical protein [Anaerolineae bacterium]MDQ7033962.1 hypothetical protein [Anaerolineae bacterium]
MLNTLCSSSKRRITLLILILFSITSVIFAQDANLTQTFISTDRSIAFNYPVGWTASEVGGAVTLSNGTVTIEFFNAELISTVNQFASDDSPRATFERILAIFSLETTEHSIEVDENEPAVIGSFVLADGQGTLALLVELNIGGLKGLGFVKAGGSAFDVIQNTDTILAIIETFGTFIEASDGTGSAGATPETGQPSSAITQAPLVITATPLAATLTPTPCTVSTNRERTVRLRVGPGLNRTSIDFLPINRQFEVQGQFDDDGDIWYQLDKFEAAPRRAAQVNEIWVAARDVTESGDCNQVGFASAPPIIPIPSSSGSSATQTPPPGGYSFDNPRIEFSLDRTSIPRGDCTTLRWDAEFVESLFLSGGEFTFQGVTGPGSRQACPSQTSTYTLTVNTRAGQVIRQVTLFVTEPGQTCTTHDVPFFFQETLSTGAVDSWFFTIDPCRTPVTITISLSSSDFDTYLWVYDRNGNYIGEDDDSGGNLNSQITITLPAGSTGLIIEVGSFNGTGSGTYSVSLS